MAAPVSVFACQPNVVPAAEDVARAADARLQGDAAPSSAHDAVAVAITDSGPRFTPPTRIVALGTWVPVRREPRREGGLVGYLRAGAITAVDGMPVGRERCPVRREYPEGGWYHLTGGGFVCVGGALAIPWPAPRGSGVLRPAQPRLDAGMPYEYGMVQGRVMMYRAPPSVDELHLHEPWRFHHDDPDAGGAASASGEATAATGSSPAPSETPDEAPAATAGTAAPAAPAATPATTTTGRRDRTGTGTAAASATTAAPTEAAAETPDGEPRLRDLRGDRNGPVIRRMLSGMYVSLDRTVLSRSDGERYWRTQSGGFLRTGPLSILHSAPTFTGIMLDESHTLPFAFMVSPHGWNYRLTANDRGASQHHSVARLTAIQLTADAPVQIGERIFNRTADGLAVLARNVRIAIVRPPPTGVGATERWIDIDLDAQVLVAYEGTRPIFVTLVSTGRRGDPDAMRDYETPAGSFRIHGKHITTTMDGDTAADGPYSIEDVPWAMYFHESYALHGAFWHGNFGWRMSHGCVNLSPADARYIFNWSDPQLPEGWHGVFSSPDRPGTRVELHHGDEPTPRTPRRRQDT